MAILQVRNVPDDLYTRIQEMAATERRSLNAEVIVLLETAVKGSTGAGESVGAILDRMKTRREAIKLPGDWPGSLDMLREDRAR